MKDQLINRLLSRQGYIVLTLLMIIIFLFKSFQSLQYKETYGSPDLRNRITGARILKHYQYTSPYFYKWKQGENEQLLDPYDSPDIKVNRTTVTPFTLQLIQPFCDYSFQSITVGWYMAETIVLLLILLLMLKDVISPLNRFLCIAIALTIIGCSQSWLLHNINGQVYIFYALLLTLLYRSCQYNNHWAAILNGLLLSVLILMRPVMIVFALPFLLQRKWRPLLYVALFAAVYFMMQWYVGSIWIWKEYGDAMNVWAVQQFNLQPVKDYLDIHPIAKLEGSSAVQYSPYQWLTENSSLAGFVYRFLGSELSSAVLMLIALFLSAVFAFSIRNKLSKFDGSRLFVFAFLLYFIAEISLPAVRNIYNSIQWVFPLLIIFSQSYIQKKSIVLLIIGGLLSLGLFKFLPFDLTLAELIFAAICFQYINTKGVNA